METFLKDLRHGLRLFVRSPGFAFAAVAALALGIGANTAVFSVVDAVLLRPLPFADPGRIVLFMETSPQGESPGASPAEFAHYAAQGDAVRDVSAFTTGVVNDTSASQPEQLRSAQVSADFFTLFGAPMTLGRGFTPDEEAPNGPRAVVISRDLWTRRFGSDRNIIGQAMSIGGAPYTIVGVLGPFDFSAFGSVPDVWTPFPLDPNATDQGHYFDVAGRLAPGVTLAAAQARVALSAAAYNRKFPNGLGKGGGFSVEPIGQVLVRNVRSSLLVLLGAVAFVLLIACANVANLLLARATGRRREIAVRAAIGGTRGRIVRQLLTESVVLSTVGGVLGLGLGWAGIRALLSVNTAGLPRVGENGASVGLDWRVLAFTLVVSVGTGVLFGVVPAIQSSKADLASTFKEASGRSGSGLRHNKTRAVLVVTEVALAIVLLVGSGLLIRTAIALAHVDPGFDARNVLTLDTSLTGPAYQRTAALAQVIRTTTDEVRRVPGVVAVSATCCVPLTGGYGLPFVIVGRPLTNGPFHGGGAWFTVSAGYFDVFRIPVVRGRAITDRDDGGATPVVVINEAMARKFWPKGDPLSDRLVIGRGVMKEFAAEPERQIVGIVGDTRDGGLNSDPQPTMYIPYAQETDGATALNLSLAPVSWVVRTRTDPTPLGPAIEAQVRQATGLPVSDMRTMDDVVARSTSRERFNMWLMSVFGAAALLLAAIGVYGLMAYAVEQRTQEIGIRLALGAPAGRVRRAIVLQGLTLALVGVAVGLGAAFGLARLLATFVYGVTTRDPLVFAGVPVALTLVALVAVWLPARRASRIDPVVALRYE